MGQSLLARAPNACRSPWATVPSSCQKAPFRSHAYVSARLSGMGMDSHSSQSRSSVAHASIHSPLDGSRSSCDQERDRKSTRLNSSHQIISYAVFCLKKKNHITSKSTAHLHYTQR